VNFMKNFKGGVGCKFGKKLKLFHYMPWKSLNEEV
jgi:hypothetical protein